MTDIEMPESWVPRLTVTRDMLDMRVPKGVKKTVYRYSEHELFALFGETSKFDGCLERLGTFADEDHQIKLEVRVAGSSDMSSGVPTIRPEEHSFCLCHVFVVEMALEQPEQNFQFDCIAHFQYGRSDLP